MAALASAAPAEGVEVGAVEDEDGGHRSDRNNQIETF
jgi:hypothetical protein